MNGDLIYKGKKIERTFDALSELTIKQLKELVKESNLKVESQTTGKPINLNIYKKNKDSAIIAIIASSIYCKYTL